MNQEKLKGLIYFHNPWWIEREVPHGLLQDYERPVFKTLLSYLDLDRILVVKGPRRAGKTTLLYQMISYLIKKGVKPESIFFLSFDDLETRGDFDEIIKLYQQLTRTPLGKQREVYFFLDEIQFLERWSLFVKRYFDKKYPIKFIVSGSAASLIKKGAESLAGRTVEEVILPFTFYEYLDYHLRDNKLRELVDNMRKDFDFLKIPLIDSLIPYVTLIKIKFEEYLERGGFPHLFHVKERVLWQKLLKEDVLEKVIYRDLLELYNIKKPVVLEKLFLYLAEHSSELLNISNISNTMALSREYTDTYIDYLRGAYLIFKHKKYSRAVEARIRKMDKCYVYDCGLIQLSMSFEPGKAVETIVAGHLTNNGVYYWRDYDYEVDLVITLKDRVVPLEVKYKNEIKLSDLKGVLRFLDVFKERLAIVVTKNHLEEKRIDNKLILCIPAWLFLLLTGHH